MNDFYRNFIKKEFPNLKIKYKDKSFIYNLNKFNSNTITCYRNTIYFPSKKFFKENSYEIINEILSHEYVHLHQFKNNKFHLLLTSLPESIGNLLIFLSSILMILNYFPIICILFLIIGFSIILFPIYPYFRIKSEFDAYKMTILVRITQWNNKFNLPKSHYNLLTLSDDMLRRIIDTLFSYHYNTAFVPSVIKNYYFKKMKIWRNACNKIYFQERFAFENGKMYIYSRNIYLRVLRYFIYNNIKPHVS